MDRLTKRNNDLGGLPVLVRGRALGPAFFSDERDYKDYADALERLAQYEDAEEQGRLIALRKLWDTASDIGKTVFLTLEEAEEMMGSE